MRKHPDSREGKKPGSARERKKQRGSSRRRLLRSRFPQGEVLRRGKQPDEGFLPGKRRRYGGPRKGHRRRLGGKARGTSGSRRKGAAKRGRIPLHRRKGTRGHRTPRLYLRQGHIFSPNLGVRPSGGSRSPSAKGRTRRKGPGAFRHGVCRQGNRPRRSYEQGKSALPEARQRGGRPRRRGGPRVRGGFGVQVRSLSRNLHGAF